MKRMLWVLLFMATLIPGAWASDLTDAIVDVDPSTKLTSGTGVAYHSAYGPEENAPAPAEELDPLQTPSLRGRYDYGNAYKGLRSPLYGFSDSAASPDSLTDEEAPASDEPWSTTVSPIPLGKPYERQGVHYQDDLQR